MHFTHRRREWSIKCCWGQWGHNSGERSCCKCHIYSIRVMSRKCNVSYVLLRVPDLWYRHHSTTTSVVLALTLQITRRSLNKHHASPSALNQRIWLWTQNTKCNLNWKENPLQLISKFLQTLELVQWSWDQHFWPLQTSVCFKQDIFYCNWDQE